MVQGTTTNHQQIEYSSNLKSKNVITIPLQIPLRNAELVVRQKGVGCR